MEEKKPSLQAVKCTQCGGSISLRGGHKVTTIVCNYCNTALDAKDEFKVLQTFAKRQRPFTPLKIGSRGKLFGVSFVVIGMLQYTQTDEGVTYPWIEHLLYSQTHGYAWLIFEDRHWVLMRKIRDLPSIPLFPTTAVKTSFEVRNRPFVVFESSIATLTYVEGEMTWPAKVNDKVSYLDAICPPYLFSVEMDKNEDEFTWGEYVPAETVYEAFGISNAEALLPKTVYCCQPMTPWPLVEKIGQIGLAFAPINLLIYFVRASNGTPIFSQTLHTDNCKDDDLAISNSFTATGNNQVYSLTVHCPLDNAWGSFDVNVVQAETAYFSLPVDLAYYQGYEDGEHWSEGNQTTSAYFRLPEPGTYTLAISGEGNTGETETPGTLQSKPLSVTVNAHVLAGDYSFWLFVLCLVCAIPHYWRKSHFEKLRWPDDDDDDEDDDFLVKYIKKFFKGIERSFS